MFVHIFILLAGIAFSKCLMAIKDPHHHDLFDPDKSGGGGSFSEFVGGQAGISPCHRSPHQRDDRQPPSDCLNFFQGMGGTLSIELREN